MIAQRAPSAQELEAQVPTHPLPAHHLDDPDFAGAPGMGATARGDVPLRDLHDPDRVGDGGRLAQCEALHALGVRPVALHRAVLPHDPVRLALQPSERAPIGVREPDLDRAALLAEVGGQRWGIEDALERRGAGGQRGRRLEQVPDPPLVVGLDVGDGLSAEGSAIRPLTAALGIEIGGLELDCGASRVLPHRGDARVETRGVGVVVVQTPRRRTRGSAHVAFLRSPYSRSFRHSVVREMPSCRAAAVAFPRCRPSTRWMCSRSTSARDQVS